MKFVVDENLPPRLANWLRQRKSIDAWHVSELGLNGATDSQVWERAIALGAYVVSRDADFLGFNSAGGLIRLLVGNCSTRDLLAYVEAIWPDIDAGVASGQRIIEI